MPARSHLIELHQTRDAILAMYGTPERGAPVVAAFGPLDLEYASLRKRCVLFDAAHRATLEIRGADRLGFLNNMVTQRVIDMKPGQSRDSFWLNRKGRIVADLRLIELGDRMLADLDMLAGPETVESLNGYLFSEDAEISDITRDTHRLWLIGPTAPLLLDAAFEPAPTSAEHTDALTTPPSALPAGAAARGKIAGVPVVADRRDLCAQIGYELTCPADHVRDVYQRLLEIGELRDHEHADPLPDTPAARIRLRPCGWHAINVARIEAGAPVFNLDFDSDCLPAETALLHSRVDFTKGCYLGQEVVARMRSLGHPKQILVALRFESSPNADAAPLPEAGAELFAPGAEKPVGRITSSTISPMLGGAPIALAMVRWGSHEPGTRLDASLGAAHADASIPARIQPQLAFWPPRSTA